MATGAVSGLVVIDIDPRKGGQLSVDDIEAEHGKFPDTVESLTGSPGRHLFYQHPGDQVRCGTDALGPGVDIKADGGYIVAPPSRHASGLQYEWEAASHPDDVPLAPLPDWFPLYDQATAERFPTPHGAHGQPIAGSPGADFNARATQDNMRALLVRHGWAVMESRDGVDYLRRPGKQGRALSATLGFVAPNVLYVFSTNAKPFEAGHGYKPYSMYGLLEHQGDFKAATRTLAVSGYGQPFTAPAVSVGTNGHRSASMPAPTGGLQDLEQTFQRWLYLKNAGPLHFMCGTLAANLMESDPLWSMLVGGPGWGKTELLNSTGRLPNVHTAATITEAALLSGTRRREKDPDAKGGLLRRIGDFGFLMLKDFTSILSMNRDVRAALLAALREIYDGSWTRHVGVDGGKELSWRGKLAIIAGCTGAIDSFHAVIGAMGERFIFYRFEHAAADDALQADKALDLVGKERQLRQELSGAMTSFFAGLTIPKQPPGLDAPDRTRLIALASLAARCRSAVERGGRTREIELIPDAEAPGRLALTLARLFAGLTCIGVDHDRAWDLLIKVALDCMPDLRRKVFLYLLEHEDTKLATPTIATALGYPTITAHRCLEDMAAHGVVIHHSAPQGKSHYWNISAWAFTLYQKATNAGTGTG